ncbi:MAG: bacillithiol biosynthesis cysteine-adding enzyme BshC [Candidatus Cohnella colombiensis]|uniref:Putative cysteine ligase BshC n=1 Tax=Candidatus Cohnella colombiensis TaxID=3121368 RepID=A0AA95ETB2_9BACL|nr:MAG: bacillithiol biosynthesis cysteine-adding enzyme BshC [Cohnella sp.]
MNIITINEQQSSSIAEQYRRGHSNAVELFGSHVSNEEHWKHRATVLDQTTDHRANMKQVAAALRSYQAQLPTYPEALASLDQLEQEGALVIVGGQQAGLFGGALLIFYKALTVVQAARHASKILNRPVIPVFWIAGEDHDYDEANHVNIHSYEGHVRRVRIERPDGPRLAVSRTSLTSEDWRSALQELAQQLPDTEYKPALLQRLKSHVTDAPTLSLAFARLLADWFGREGLILLDADDPNMRALEAPMFRELIERNNELEQALKEGECRVTERGFPLQAQTAQASANLFLHHDQGRLLIHKDEDRFKDRKGIVSLTKEQMIELTVKSPDVLSTNALTRPLMQDYVLPVLGAVLGPAELAYWGILGQAFHLFNRSIPLLIPRQSFTYLDNQVAKLLEKYELTVEEALNDWEVKKTQWLSAQDEWKLEEKFQQAREQFVELYDPIIDTVSEMQPGLTSLALGNQQKIIEQINYMESRALDALAKQHDAALRQWDRIHQALKPLDRPQERVYGTIHLLNRYGPAWLAHWIDVPFEVTGGQRLVEKA